MPESLRQTRESMSESAAHSPASARNTGWGVAVAIAAVLLVVYPLRYILLPFVAAGALAYVARPMVHWLHRRYGFHRPLAAGVPFLLLLGILAAVSFGLSKTVAPEIQSMISEAPTLLHEFLFNIFGPKIHLLGKDITIDDAVKSIMNSPQLQAASNPNEIVTLATAGFAAIMGIVLTIVLFAFFLFQGPRLARGLLWLFPPHMRHTVHALAVKADPMLARYLRGVCLIVLYTAGVTYIVTGLVFHVSHAVLLAIAVGLLELIPVIGPILSFIAFGLVAVQEKGFGTIIGFGAFAIALRLSIDQMVGPLVLGRAARLPATVVIFAFLAGGVLYGILGVVLAIPVAATVKIVLMDLYEKRPHPPTPIISPEA